MTIESQVDGKEFKMIVTKFLSEILAPKALVYITFFLKKLI